VAATSRAKKNPARRRGFSLASLLEERDAPFERGEPAVAPVVLPVEGEGDATDAQDVGLPWFPYSSGR
jgi:hypothetical protein